MSKQKRVFVLVVLAVILLLCGSFITLDWQRLSIEEAYHSFYKNPVARTTKQVVSLLCSLMVWTIGKDCADKKDVRKLQVVFIFTFLGDLSFFLKQSMAGIIFFAVCQILLIWRNSKGLKDFILKGGILRNKRLFISIGIVLICMDGTFLYFVSHLVGTGVFRILCIYVLLLSTSLLVGWAAKCTDTFERINGRLIAIGMTLFVAGDIAVGLVMALKPGFSWLVADSIIWMLYVPTLVVLGLSGYQYKIIEKQ